MNGLGREERELMNIWGVSGTKMKQMVKASRRRVDKKFAIIDVRGVGSVVIGKEYGSVSVRIGGVRRLYRDTRLTVREVRIAIEKLAASRGGLSWERLGNLVDRIERKKLEKLKALKRK